MKALRDFVVNVFMVSVTLFGLAIAAQGYALLPPTQMVIDLNQELNEGGFVMVIGFGIMSIGIVRLISHIETLFVIAIIVLGYLYKAYFC